MRVLPRQLNVRFLPDWRTGKEHNVLEVCDSKHGVRYVMAQDSETNKERDKYKLRARLLKEENDKLEEALKRVSNCVRLLEARVEHLEQTPKRYTEEDWLVLQEAKDLLDELETEKKQNEL